MSLDGRARRRKGQAGEREGAGLLSGLFGRIVRRCLGQERDGGADVVIGQYHVQIKNQRRWRVWEWFRQAEADTPEGGKAILMLRVPGNRGQPVRWLIVQAVEDWAEAVRDGLDSGLDSKQEIAYLAGYGTRDELGRRSDDVGPGLERPRNQDDLGSAT